MTKNEIRFELQKKAAELVSKDPNRYEDSDAIAARIVKVTDKLMEGFEFSEGETDAEVRDEA